MNKMDKENIFKLFENFNSHTDDYIGAMYVNIFKEFPHAYRIFYNEKGQLSYVDSIESFYEYRKSISKKIDSRKLLQNMMKDYKKYNVPIHYGQSEPDHILNGGVIFCYSLDEYLIVGSHDNINFIMRITLSDSGEIANIYEDIYCSEDKIDIIFNNIKVYFEEAVKQEKVDFGIASLDVTNTIYTNWYDYKFTDVDIDKNYNDDFKPVYNKMCNIIEEDDKASLILLYGEPGTGKSTILKHFISKYPDRDFVFIDDQLMRSASPEKLLSYFLQSQNTVFILEDCEKSLTSRDQGYNPVMSTLLNITDGIISDVLGIKLICTFNTNLNNIDKALLRKGRLSLKYEFKKLKKEKASVLLEETAKEDMTLADIYNYKEEVDFSQKQTKIGF